MNCRFCNSKLDFLFVDLGTAPPSNSYLTYDDLHGPEKWYPLRVFVCTNCWLVQTEDFVGVNELFLPNYAYFSSYSDTWLYHARLYVEKVIERFRLGKQSLVIEVAANDGYLLQYVKERNIPCLGIEPTHSTAEAARAKGIEIIEEFFGTEVGKKLGSEGIKADLIVANNVLAHVPNINDFVSGFTYVLKPDGVATFEFPHLLRLVEEVQFDTIYHEHFSYLSLTAVKCIFEANGLYIFDVEELPTHGGSLRIYVSKDKGFKKDISSAVQEVLIKEKIAGIEKYEFYASFQPKTEKIKYDLLEFLISAKRQDKKIAAYGAAAKGNTLLNYAGVRRDLLSFVADRNPAKQGKYLPGSHIPIVGEHAIIEKKPDYILILPWNLKREIMEQLSYTQNWGAKFVTAIPHLKVEGLDRVQMSK
ncbi:MAG: class I SAM-dependent methyltransferase [Syntrophales bacterium]|nr:class I SAM-dependent methyltransferase [Syntrophales bacterium]